jgi:WD40 repeat protein
MTTLAFHPAGRTLAAGTEDGRFRFWDINTLETIRLTGKVLDGNIRAVAFSPDGALLAAGSQNGKLVVWDYQTGKVHKTFRRKTPVTNVMFSPDGKSVAASYDAPEAVVCIWDLSRPDPRVLAGHTDHVLSAVFRTDGKLLASGSWDGTMRLWSTAADYPRALVYGPGLFGTGVTHVAFSPDGRYLATPNGDGTIYLFRLPPLNEPIATWMEKNGVAPPPDLPEEGWIKRVQRLTPGNQAEAVSQRLKDLNPGFDGGVIPTVEDGLLVGVNFRTNQISDLSPVKAITTLKQLHIHGHVGPDQGKVHDLRPLHGLRLETLSLWNTEARDLAPLRDMPLKSLDLGGCHGVKDLSPLTGMDLEWLDLGATGVTDLTPLGGMPLNWLSLWNTKGIDDLAPLKGMPLRTLNLVHCPVKDISLLSGMKLEDLDLGGTGVIDATPLAGMPLRRLSLGTTRVSDLTPLKDMPLRELILADCGSVKDLSPLKGMKLEGKRSRDDRRCLPFHG